MKNKFKSYLMSRKLTVLTLITLFFGFTIFISNTSMGKSNEKAKSTKTKITNKRTQQSSKPSKNLQKANTSAQVGIIPQEQILLFPDYADLDPFTEMSLLQRRMDRIFASTFNRFRSSPGFVLRKAPHYVPQMDLREAKDKYIILIDLPGMKKSNIKVTFAGNNLVISGKREHTIKKSKDNKIISYERSYGTFTRVCSLPGPVDKSKTNAKYKNGVLTVTVAKLPVKKAKAVAIKVE